MNFEAFVNDIESNKWNVYGVEVYEAGKLTHSFGDTTGLHHIYSATKSVLSVAVGIAYDEGMFDLEKPFIEYLPKDKTSALSDEQYKTFSKISVKRLLTMSVPGFPFRPEGDKWIDFSLSCKVTDPDKKEFNYNNICAYLVGVCLTEAIGSDMGTFIEERIFKPLNIQDYEYGRCPEGYFYGASDMKLSVHDLSKIGLLLYNKGTYDGVRIISEEYTKLATSVHQMNREGGYGFFIWKYKDGFRISGKWKQKCYILPEREMIITFLSHIEEELPELQESMEKNMFKDLTN